MLTELMEMAKHGNPHYSVGDIVRFKNDDICKIITGRKYAPANGNYVYLVADLPKKPTLYSEGFLDIIIDQKSLEPKKYRFSKEER